MIHLVFAESSLEIVPVKLQRHASVRSHARKRGKHPSKILLDNSWHYAAMRGIRDEIKRGRPDIVHFSLLAAASTPLYSVGMVQIYIHTINDLVITVGRNVNVPKSYHRFVGVFEKLLDSGEEVKTETDHGGAQTLLKVQGGGFADLIKGLKPSKVIGLSVEGVPASPPDVARQLKGDACLVIGGFQKGHFADSTKASIDQMYSVNKSPLESHVVTSRVLYEYEKTVFM